MVIACRWSLHLRHQVCGSRRSRGRMRCCFWRTDLRPAGTARKTPAVLIQHLPVVFSTSMLGELKNTHKINNGNLGFHNPLEPLRSSNATMIVGARSKTEQCLNRIELGTIGACIPLVHAVKINCPRFVPHIPPQCQLPHLPDCVR